MELQRYIVGDRQAKNNKYPRISLSCINNRGLSNIVCLMVMLVLIGCGKNSDDGDMARMYWYGDTEYLLKSEAKFDIYKGMIYEYGVDVPVDLDKAKEYYSGIRDKKLSAKRHFMLCFVHCPEQLKFYFEKTSQKYPDINILYAIDTVLLGNSCNNIVDDESCAIANDLVDNVSRDKFFYEVGVSLYETAIKKAIEKRSGGKSVYELPSYLLMKSSRNGNIDARIYLSSIKAWYSWIPRKNSL